MRWTRRACGAAAITLASLSCCLMFDAPATPQGALLQRLSSDGQTYAVFADGRAYRQRGDGWVLVEALFEPGEQERAYQTVNGVVHRRTDAGELVALPRELRSGFEAESLRELIGLEHGWTTFTLQSPRAREVADYVALRREILAGGPFRDNALEVVDQGRGGGRALRATSVGKASGMVCCKASLSSELLHAVRGDELSFDGWFLIAEGTPFTLVDVETTWIVHHPGMRVAVWDERYLGMELKWADKPVYRQARGREIDLPRGRWFRLRFSLLLSEGDDGRVRLWQDDALLLDARGRTLPLAHCVYNDLEVGISATSEAASVLVDDVSVAVASPR